MKRDFRLVRILNDGSETEVALVPVALLPPGTEMGRRVFFRAGIGISAAAVMLAGCGTDAQPSEPAKTQAASPPPPPPAVAQQPSESPAGTVTDSSTPPAPEDIESTPKTPAPTAAAPKKTKEKSPERDDDTEPAPRPAPRPAPTYSTPQYSTPSYSSPGVVETRPCTPEPIPAGYTCECNCIAR